MATDYISREAALDFLIPTSDLSISVQDKRVIGDRFGEFLESIPAADVRPVVLCRDCRWWTKQEKSLQGRCELGGYYPTGEWFCANGERIVK